MIKSIMIVSIVLFILLTGCSENKSYYNNTNHPTIDFLQPWAFCDKTEKEISEHFQKLNEIGIDTLIIQNIAKFEKGNPKICYYDSIIDYPTCYPDFLSKILAAAKLKNIKIIVGLTTDTYWWKYSEHMYEEDIMEVFYQEEVQTLKELLNKYTFDGVYYSNEMYSNPYKYYKPWSNHLNRLINDLSLINSQMPFYISPFISSAFLKNNKNVVKEWENFFKKVNFREFDYFMIQDGFGNCSSNPTEKECEKIFQRNTKIRNKCLEYSKANFILNVELFATDGKPSASRIKKQIEYANKLGNKIACFSISHYYIDDKNIFK